MKRFLLTVVLALISVVSALSQEVRIKDNPDELFYYAAQLYREKEFSGSYRTLSTWFERSNNPTLLEDANFLRATVSYELDKRDASLLLINFIKDYPLSVKLPRAYYLLGCTAMQSEQYEDAILYFKQCPEASLTKNKLDEYRFRVAYASLMVKDYELARTLFKKVIDGTNRYIPSATYFLAYMDYADGKIKEAKSGFEKVDDQVQYQNVTEYFKLQLLYIEGSLDKMIPKAEAMLKLKPSQAQKTELVRLLGAAWFDKGKYSLSQSYYQEYMLMTNNIDRSDLYRIGINYIDQFNFPSAINYLTRASGKQDAISQSAAYHIGLCYLKQKKKDLARMSFEQVSLQTFDRATQEKALYNYALICYDDAYSPFNEQTKAFQRLLTEFPNSVFATSANNLLADVFLSSKDYAGSINYIDSLPHPEPSMLQTKCKLLFLYGVEKYNTQQFVEAQQLFSQSALMAIENNFPLEDILYWKGESNYRLGYIKEALEDYLHFSQEPLNQKSPAYALVNYQLGYCSFKLGNFEEAKVWFEKYIAQKSIKKDNTYTDALNRIGDCAFQAKDITKAELAYQAANSSQSAGSDYAYYQLAMCQGARQKNSEKANQLEKFEKKFPQSIYLDKAIFELANTYLLIDQKDKAIASYQKIAQLFPDSPLCRKALLQIATLLWKNEAIDEAVSAYKLVIEKFPESEEAQQALDGLKAILIKNNNRVSDYLNYTAGLKGLVKIETGEEDSLAFQSADKFYLANQQNEAIQGYKYYLGRFSSGAFRDESRFKLGRLLLASGRIQEGLSELDTLANSTGNAYQVSSMMLLAEGYIASKNYALALNQYQQLENLSKDQMTRQAAVIGIIRCSYDLELYKNTVDAANRMLNVENPGSDIKREAIYYKAMSMLKDGQAEKAIVELKALGKETFAAFGAEARFRLAEYLFDQGSEVESETEIRAFLKEGTPHSYWLARSSVLLADICMKQGKNKEAKQYLESLKQNYKKNDDVQEMISKRLLTLSQKSN